MFKIKQFVSQDYCLSCLGCCRYNRNPSIWAPNLLKEEKKLLGQEKIKLIPYKESYICCFLNPENNHCRIYVQRPLECRLYPFLLNRQGKNLYLSVDLNCPNIQDKINSKEFKRYLNYLIRYLQSPRVLRTLSKNRQAFSSYPKQEVLNLVKIIP